MHKTLLDDALFLGVETNNFKGRNGELVTYTKVKYLDNENNYGEATLDKDLDLSELQPRTECKIELELREDTRNGVTKLKKKVIDVI